MVPLFISAAVVVAAKPNIVYVMTDDQDVELGGMTPMKQVRELLGEQGAVGESFYIATPICCPSRTETLSGRLYHNVLTDNLRGCMHVDQTKYIFEHSSSLFPQMQSAGYLTGGFGKVRLSSHRWRQMRGEREERRLLLHRFPPACANLSNRTLARHTRALSLSRTHPSQIINGQKNQFGAKPPITNGWDWISAPFDEGDYFSGGPFFEQRPNGSQWSSMLGNKSQVVDEWYQTAQIGNRSLEFIEYAVKVAKKPFLAYLGPHAPHYSADAPPWARDLFSDMKAPRTPAYNISVGQADKTLHVMQNPSWDVGSSMETHIDIHFRDRWRAIVGVDDLVGLVHDALKTMGVLDNTYIFFTRCVQGREMRGGSRSRARAPHAAQQAAAPSWGRKTMSGRMLRTPCAQPWPDAQSPPAAVPLCIVAASADTSTSSRRMLQ